ncbi:MAG: DUF4129 domain-containing transglutaminase family protein, partial [Thermomicrobiales bacterium]
VLNRAETAWQDAGLPSHDGASAGSYNTFPASFKIGQELKLSDSPVASLQAASNHYLAARRWDYFDGHVWATHVDETYRRAGGRSGEQSSPISFAANQSTPYSPDVTSEREPVAGIVTMLQGNPGPALTIETFLAISEPARGFMGWMGIDRQVDVAAVDAASLPVDLQSLVLDLKSATFETAASGGIQIVDPGVRNAVAAKIGHLAEFPVAVKIDVDASRRPSVRFTGRLPVYDDLEVIVPARGLRAGDRYRVVGLGSQATREDLQAAGSAYPTWVTDRYLQLPTTVTERTRALASRIVAESGAATPFDQAWAIQQYLQTSFTYALNSDPAPDDQDFVDYFLFTSKVGRCEQYASSMAVMLRTLGVPTRMVGGYRAAGGEQDGAFLSREKQAHTWVEAYFPTFGWIPFEPTAGQAPFAYGEKIPATESVATPGPFAVASPPPAETPAAPTATAAPAPAATVADPPETSGLLDSLGGKRGVAILAAVLGVVLFSAIGYGIWMRGLRGLPPAAALYARTRRVGRLWGIEPDPTMTPYEFAAEFERSAPSAAKSVHVVTDLYLAEHFGRRTVDSAGQTSGRIAWREVRRSALRWRPFRRRAPRGSETAG